MSKRSREKERDQRPTKRSKHDQGHKPPPVEDIQFARQLKQLLAFQQDGISQLRHGIASLKAFLDSILYHTGDDDRARQLSILREYLDSEKPIDVKDFEQPYLSQLWQAWSFANQNNNDHLASSIAAIFALLLKVLSSLLDFREHGILLCRTVLQHRHLRLIKWCLNAPKQKDFLISPCLRLLIEVTSFDGGVLARDVYKNREETFDIGVLKRNLGLVKTDISEEEQQRRPSIRTWTVRYILALLKYLHEGGKIDLLKVRPICTGLFQHLKDDPSDLIIELLAVTEQHALKDDELPRSAKSSLLVQQNLERVTEVATRSHEDRPASEKAFNWLKLVCSTPSYGILRNSGWYPPGTTRTDRAKRKDDIIDLGLDSVEFYDRDVRPDVRNTTLLAWLQNLRPHSNLQDRELALTCFTSAPELVAAYLAEKNMQLDPKLSNTWVGYASFLFEIVRLPVPHFHGDEDQLAQLPPQTNIMIESILPRPLTQKVLTRCLNQSSDLITFFAVRILVLAFEKLAKLRAQVDRAALDLKYGTDVWKAASDRLLARLIDRCPKTKDFIAAFRKTPDDDDHALQREALARLLRLYHEVAPIMAVEEQFDVSSALVVALKRQQSKQDTAEIDEVKALELTHLLQIARHTPGIRWFSKQGGMEISPILTLLQIHIKDRQDSQMRDLIFHVLSENAIVSTVAACDTLVATMLCLQQNDTEYSNLTDLAPYLDDWLLRITRKPVKYLDDLDTLGGQISENSQSTDLPQTPSLIVAVLLEQAPFVSEIKDENLELRLMTWINSYVDLLMRTEEKCAVLESVRSTIFAIEGWKVDSNPSNPEEVLSSVSLTGNTIEQDKEINGISPVKPKITFESPPMESEDHPELLKWARKDLETALEDGDVDSLVLCLCSQHQDVRIQAHSQLLKLAQNVLDSALEDKQPIYILLGELLETYEHHYAPKLEPFPYIAGTFAARTLHVQRQPTHYIYPKLNAYLNKSPLWRISSLPRYWLDHTIRSMPSDDDAYWKEVLWVLQWLVDGSRTQTDMEILRRAGVFEELMCLYASPAAGKQVKERLLEVLWRATFVEGGSDTLITRTGVLAWLDLVNEGGDGIEIELRQKIIETCDREKIEKWTGGMKLEDL